MRFLVLGAGLQGSACAYDLLQQGDAERITLADLDPGRAAHFVPDDPRLHRVETDFGDQDAVARLMHGHDVALSAAPYYFNDQLAEAAIAGACHFADLGGNTEIVRRQLELDEAARGADRAVIPDLGLAPGMINILAADGIQRLDAVRSVRMYVGGLPQNPIPPLNYQVAYSLEGMLDYYTTRSWILRGGALEEVEALSEVEPVHFEGLGALEAFHTAGGASLMPWEYEGTIDELAYKTLRYPGHADLMRAVRELGLLSEEPIEVNGRPLVPRDTFIACVTPLLTKPDEPGFVALRVVADGERDDLPATITYDVLDRTDETTGISAMERTTGFTLSIAGLFVGRGVVTARGAAPAYRMIPYEPYVKELAGRGIRVRRSG